MPLVRLYIARGEKKPKTLEEVSSIPEEYYITPALGECLAHKLKHQLSSTIHHCLFRKNTFPINKRCLMPVMLKQK